MKQNDFELRDLRTSSHRKCGSLVIAIAIGLITAVILGLAPEIQVAVTNQCHRETPLPVDVRLIPPGKEVPESLAWFAGAWLGAWTDKETDALCHTLVVEEVFANGYARVIYSIGTYAGWNIRQPNFWRATGRITDGVLRFHLPVPDRPNVTYRFAGETLLGNFKGEAHASLTRLPNLQHVDCGSQVRGGFQGPPAAGPRDRLTADELLAPTYTGDGPVHNNYFLPIGQAAPALHVLKGILTIEAWSMFSANHGCVGIPFSN